MNLEYCYTDTIDYHLKLKQDELKNKKKEHNEQKNEINKLSNQVLCMQNLMFYTKEFLDDMINIFNNKTNITTEGDIQEMKHSYDNVHKEYNKLNSDLEIKTSKLILIENDIRNIEKRLDEDRLDR